MAAQDKQAKADAKAKERAAAKALAQESAAARRQARSDAKAKAKESAQAAAKAKKSRNDHIVEAPRAPKVSLRERRRQAKQERALAKQEARIEPGERTASGPAAAVPRRRRIGLLAAGVLGAAGLMCSVILAMGALLVALGTGEGNALYDLTSSICDVLVGPLRDAFSFAGANAEMKESLVAWGAGSIAYLMIGIFVQSFLRARFSDD